MEPSKNDLRLGERHETARGGERIVIRRIRPEDVAQYTDFIADVSPDDLRLRFFAHIARLSAEERKKLSHLDYLHEMAFIAVDEAPVACSGSCA